MNQDVVTDNIKNEALEIFCDDNSNVPFAVKTVTYNWRQFVPEGVKDIWEFLTEREKLLVSIVAESNAQRIVYERALQEGLDEEDDLCPSCNQ